MRDGIYLLLKEMVNTTDTGRTGWSLEIRYGRMLAELFRKDALQFLVKCVIKCVLVE